MTPVFMESICDTLDFTAFFNQGGAEDQVR
jgi:hypothetical protein